jgi:hypothetical protein
MGGRCHIPLSPPMSPYLHPFDSGAAQSPELTGFAR